MGAVPASAAPWVKGFVVGAYEYAFRYGGRSDYSRGAEIEPGVDCPHGSSVFMANPDQTRMAIVRQKWRSQQEIDWVEDRKGKLFAYELKWNKDKRAKVPSAWKEGYPDAKYKVISKENYLEWIT